ncbi:hypothetical protein HU200_058442 [Digitaria exilis]|uniref:RNase H type-1 domain-containing protein n=1 Tax=Digitaria exilis TaxID=1010633 RepID=A0A835AFS1_9POAL|nr:hypothetical protein HU200_058442 [Digitaria exilis]
MVKLVSWRAWTVHNNTTHQSGPTSIAESVHFLLAIQSSLRQVRQGVEMLDRKGKRPCAAGLGVVVRNDSGGVLLSAWKMIQRCSGAAEAEAMACVEGLRLAAQFLQEPVIVESDCARVVQAVQAGGDRSELSFLVAEAIEQAQLLRDWKIVQVRR